MRHRVWQLVCRVTRWLRGHRCRRCDDADLYTTEVVCWHCFGFLLEETRLDAKARRNLIRENAA